MLATFNGTWDWTAIGTLALAVVTLAAVIVAGIAVLVVDRDVRVLDARTGELIRSLTLDPSRDYQPIGGG